MAHTLNGTAVTWRHIIALLENGQREDGSVALPACLVPYGAPSELAPSATASERWPARRRGWAGSSNVESSLVISNSRRTVGLETTSAMRPCARVTRRSPLSSTLRPVESMNSTLDHVDHDGRALRP